jgi:hypothetical protein
MKEEFLFVKLIIKVKYTYVHDINTNKEQSNDQKDNAKESKELGDNDAVVCLEHLLSLIHSLK